jgi:hypothetical protein
VIGGGPGKGRGRPSRRPEGAEAIGSVLGRVLKDLRLEERSRDGALASAWERAAGPELSPRARPVSLRSGVLTVEVDGATLLQEVRGFRAREILSALRGLPGGAGVREVRYVPAGRAGGGGGR